jgi:hypothetical protein
MLRRQDGDKNFFLIGRNKFRSDLRRALRILWRKVDVEEVAAAGVRRVFRTATEIQGLSANPVKHRQRLLNSS